MDKAGVGQLLQKLVAADGLAGAEGRAQAVVLELVKEYADELRTDALGNVIALRRGAASPPGRIMLAAHLDEIGLIVTRVEHGFLYVGEVGGLDPRTLIGQDVTVYPTGPGAENYPDGLPGYIGCRPPHVLSAEERGRVTPLHELLVDLGGKGARGQGSKEDKDALTIAQQAVRVGDRVALRGPHLELLAGRVVTKALDDRAGVAAMIAALGYLAEMRHTWDVYAVATAQEEVGLRGAMTSAYGIAPDLAIAIDVTFGETPGLKETETVPMDKGPTIGWGPNLHPGVVKKLRQVADALEIPYINEPLPGGSGTDAWAIQVTREGIPAGLLSIPIRYMHSPTEMVVLADVDRTARLLAAFISRLDEQFLGGLVEEV